MTDVFAIQDEICQAIVEKLRVQLAAGFRSVKRYTGNVEAYSLYLRGHYQLHKYTTEGFAKSKEYLEQAVAADPNFAPAWFGLAETHWYFGFLGFTRPRTANINARQAVLRALALDEMLPEAHAMMAILQLSEFDWKGSERSFVRALELGPQSPFVWWTYSLYYLLPMRRLDEAVEAARKALELDPLSALLQWQVGFRYFYREQHDRAIEHFRNALELDPQYIQAHIMLGACSVLAGKTEEGVQACETGVKLGGRTPLNLVQLGAVYAWSGRTDDAKQVLDELHGLAQNTYVSPMYFAEICCVLGAADEAFDWIDQAVDEHDCMIINILAFRLFNEPLHSHPRYHALLRKMNLEA